MANSVPLGQAGTGSAFVLGENKALNRYLENQDYNAKVDRQNALLKQKQQAQIAEQRKQDWTKGALKAEGGLIFPDIDKRANDYMTKAKEMYLKGENPYAPDSPLTEERRMIEMSVDKRKALQPVYLQELKNIDPSKQTPESIDELMNYQNLPIEEALVKGIPQLKPKFDPIKLINDVKIGTETEQYDKNGRTIKTISTDPDTVNKTVVSRLKNEPSINSYLANDLGIPKEFTIDILENMPNTVEKVKENVIQEYSGNKAFREQLATTYGITSKDDPKLTALMLQKASENLQYKKSYDTFKKSLSDAIIAKNPSQESNTVDYSALNYQRNLRKDSEVGSEKNEATFRQQLIDGILNNSKSHIDKLKAYLPSGSEVEYKTSKKVDGKSKGGYDFVRIHIPSKYDAKTDKTIIGFDEDIPISKGDAANRLNSILNDYTNKVNMDKLNIEGGKPRGEEVSIKGQAKTSQGKKQPKQFVSKSGIKVTIE